jgi:hypothetical protein
MTAGFARRSFLFWRRGAYAARWNAKMNDAAGAAAA